ncbi:hypothetical protein SARC_13821 [Sphaeroforma arctica JP610]|uniref:Alternative oxidase n=1 Tax=Sphaeroforma arctica JP610 TaxID=667725 RepID=A0A0L0FA65_9EUKA|nr:hypothetical protein SARC_13821 [Sphaeroforma arctica JP610]KNC73620.1 hypothetical protein SARC_13821 [Sphaeroforma arctica JP610]|eukprot:XP_014147522.1 hypothetical protein SARC_13821 [Sphaeroforma arctica JP610]
MLRNVLSRQLRPLARHPSAHRKLSTVRTIASKGATAAKYVSGTLGGVIIASYLTANVLGDPLPKETTNRPYHWISPEAQTLIARSYERHNKLADSNKDSLDKLSVPEMMRNNAQLVKMSTDLNAHYEPQKLRDRLSYVLMTSLEHLMHLFFREKYDHHAVTLETLAAVPGIVASAFRHARSLRQMQPDHGWINPLQEEAENERMHLLIWMQVTQPTWLERQFVTISQGAYALSYGILYGFSPSTAHRFVGYLEEAAVSAYTDFIAALDSGAIENKPAPVIAREYYNLPKEATIRDVALRVRADEYMHRDFNHELGDMHTNGHQNLCPNFMSTEIGKRRVPAGPWERTSTGTLKRTWTDDSKWDDEPVNEPKLPQPGSFGVSQ